MSRQEIEERILQVAQMAIDEPWSDVQGVASALAQEIAG